MQFFQNETILLLRKKAYKKGYIQGVSKVRSDFSFAQISLIIKTTFCKTKYVNHYSFNIK